MEVRFPVLLLLSGLLSCCIAELDINVVILDDRNYNEPKFQKIMAEFNFTVIENGTVRKMIPNPPEVKALGFINPVLCVGTDCFTEAAGPAIPSTSPPSLTSPTLPSTQMLPTPTPIPTPVPTPTQLPTPQHTSQPSSSTPQPTTPVPITPSPASNQSEIIVIASLASVSTLFFLWISCYYIITSEQKRRTRLKSCLKLHHSHRVVIRETIEWPVHSATSLLC